MIIKKEDEGTQDYNRRQKIKMKLKTPYLQVMRRRKKIPCSIYREDTKKLATKSDLTLPYHHVVHVISVVRCCFMSHHVPHHFLDYVNSIMDKYNINFKSKSHTCNVKSQVGSQKVVENSNKHEGSPRVTREVKDHSTCYIYTLIVQDMGFSPWLLP